jgi:hypothetical protein
MSSIEGEHGPSTEEPGFRQRALRGTERSLEGAHATEALLGTATAVLALVALLGVLPEMLAPIAIVVFGVALLFEGAATASRYQRLSAIVPAREHEQAQVGGGITIEVVAGAAGVALGVLALAGIEPSVLLPIACMVYGAAYVMSGGLHPALESWVERGEAMLHNAVPATRRHQLTHRAVGTGAATRSLAGITSAMLGILALAAVGPATPLALASLLTLGIAGLLGALAFTARMSTLSHQS